MTGLMWQRATIVWVLLLGMTNVTGWLAETHRGIHWAAFIVVMIASVKIYLTMRNFMELKTAPNSWRFAMATWLVVATCVALSGWWIH